MATKTSICNLALHRLGCERIDSIQDDVKQAIVLKDIYNEALKQALEMHRWTFALTRARLTNDGVTPAFGYKYQFEKPEELIRVWKEYNDEPFIEENNLFLADAPTLDFEYIYNNTDPITYTPQFVRVLSLLLALEACYTLTQDKELKTQIQTEFQLSLDEAMFSNSQATKPENLKYNSFINVRL